MLFELLLNGTDRFLKLRDTEMEMVWHPAQAFRDRSILLSDAANRRPKTSRSIRAYTCKNPHRTLRDGPFGVALFQALRARLRSHRPSGTFQTRFS
jgi:hypothetical protein